MKANIEVISESRDPDDYTWTSETYMDGYIEIENAKDLERKMAYSIRDVAKVSNYKPKVDDLIDMEADGRYCTPWFGGYDSSRWYMVDVMLKDEGPGDLSEMEGGVGDE